MAQCVPVAVFKVKYCYIISLLYNLYSLVKNLGHLWYVSCANGQLADPVPTSLRLN